jgi:hypothetical protein
MLKGEMERYREKDTYECTTALLCVRVCVENEKNGK